jgi:hypothetical protein
VHHALNTIRSRPSRPSRSRSRHSRYSLVLAIIQAGHKLFEPDSEPLDLVVNLVFELFIRLSGLTTLQNRRSSDLVTHGKKVKETYLDNPPPIHARRLRVPDEVREIL